MFKFITAIIVCIATLLSGGAYKSYSQSNLLGLPAPNDNYLSEPITQENNFIVSVPEQDMFIQTYPQSDNQIINESSCYCDYNNNIIENNFIVSEPEQNMCMQTYAQLDNDPSCGYNYNNLIENNNIFESEFVKVLEDFYQAQENVKPNSLQLYKCPDVFFNFNRQLANDINRNSLLKIQEMQHGTQYYNLNPKGETNFINKLLVNDKVLEAISNKYEDIYNDQSNKQSKGLHEIVDNCINDIENKNKAAVTEKVSQNNVENDENKAYENVSDVVNNYKDQINAQVDAYSKIAAQEMDTKGHSFSFENLKEIFEVALVFFIIKQVISFLIKKGPSFLFWD